MRKVRFREGRQLPRGSTAGKAGSCNLRLTLMIWALNDSPLTKISQSWGPACIWHDTQCICVIKPIWLMTSQPMYVWNHTHCMHDTIGTLHAITPTLADNIPLFLYHGTNYVYDIICIIYDVTHSVCMSNPALYLTWNTLKLTSLPLHMSSHPLLWRHHNYSVRYHRCHMYGIFWVIQDVIAPLYDNLYY